MGWQGTTVGWGSTYIVALHLKLLFKSMAYDWILDELIVEKARGVAKERGWKEWDYRWNNKVLTVWERGSIFGGVKIPISKIVLKKNEKSRKPKST